MSPELREILEKFLKKLQQFPSSALEGLDKEHLRHWRSGFQRGMAEGFSAGMLEGVELGFGSGMERAVEELIKMLLEEEED